MSSHAEITAKFARAYVKASKADKGQILDQAVQVTGWSRDNARRRLTVAARPPGAGRQVAKRSRQQRTPKYSYDALKVLQKVCAAPGGHCGRYLAASMGLQLAALERHGELVDGQDRYGPQVRAELLAISSATIDRDLRPVKARDPIEGKSTTKASPLLRSAIKTRKATDEVVAAAGFFGGDTVAHCGPTLKGEFVRIVSTADGRRRRLYDEPRTPLDRLLAAQILSPAQGSELLAYRDSLNPAAIGRQIADLQAALLKLAKDKTEQLYLDAVPSALPVRSGIRIKNKTAS